MLSYALHARVHSICLQCYWQRLQMFFATLLHFLFYSEHFFYICGSNEGVYEVNCYFHSINSFCSSGSSQSFLHMANYTWLTVTGCNRGKISPPPNCFLVAYLNWLASFLISLVAFPGSLFTSKRYSWPPFEFHHFYVICQFTPATCCNWMHICHTVLHVRDKQLIDGRIPC